MFRGLFLTPRVFGQPLGLNTANLPPNFLLNAGSTMKGSGVRSISSSSKIGLRVSGSIPVWTLRVSTPPLRAVSASWSLSDNGASFDTRDVVDELGSRREVEYAYRILEHGTSADRQLATFDRTGDLKAVVDQLIVETAEGVRPLSAAA